MQFNDYLATFPAVDALAGIQILDGETEVHHIPAIAGKLGSLRLYNALAAQFNGVLNAESAQQGLVYFAEHVADARENAGKHPNIDLLFRVIEANLTLTIVPVKA